MIGSTLWIESVHRGRGQAIERPRDRAIVMLLYGSGLRICEALSLVNPSAVLGTPDGARLAQFTDELLYHPHVRAVVSAGGSDLAAQRWVPVRRNDRHLFPVRALAKLVRGIVREAVLSALDAGALGLPPHELEPVRRALFETRWHVYAKAPFAGAQQVFACLGRYTHRVGISNARLIRYDQFTRRGHDGIHDVLPKQDACSETGWVTSLQPAEPSPHGLDDGVAYIGSDVPVER